jgi:hypothetical protein
LCRVAWHARDANWLFDTMGMSRERKVLFGLGAVAVAGLMFDKAFLGPAGASASQGTPDGAPARASAAAPVQAAAGAVASRLEGSVRDAMQRLLDKHTAELMPQMQFGPDPAWTQKVVPDNTAAEPKADPAPTREAVMTGVLPGLVKTPQLSLVMPTRDGGLAVIDGHKLQAGQTHPDGYTLTAVHARSVTVVKDGVTATLSLPSPGN